jgi:uncharacterized membrane protein YcjF (UPF0283 family)
MTPIVREKTQNGLWRQFAAMYRWGKIAFSVGIVLFATLLLGQGLWIVRTAGEVHPWLGGLVGVGLLAACGYLLGVPMLKYLRTPKVVEPPTTSTGAVQPSDVRQLTRYLDKVLANGLANPALSDTHAAIRTARPQLADFARKARTVKPLDAVQLDKELAEWADRTLPAIWKPIDQRVERLIYQEAVTVGVATALSPNGTLDAYVMLWRSTNLISEIATIYYGRPGFLGTLAVCRDVAVATAVAGYVQSVTDSLGNLALHSIGGVTGVVAGPAMDGVTNALVLTRIGYLAQRRCHSYRPWNPAMRKSALLSAISSTRKVAFGLSSEVLRTAGVGIGAVAGAAASSVAMVAESAAEKVGAAASAVAQSAAGIGSTLKNRILGAAYFGRK